MGGLVIKGGDNRQKREIWVRALAQYLFMSPA
jgi:hypothetical protein